MFATNSLSSNQKVTCYYCVPLVHFRPFSCIIKRERNACCLKFKRAFEHMLRFSKISVSCTHNKNMHCLLCSGLPRGLDKECFFHLVIAASVLINTTRGEWSQTEGAGVGTGVLSLQSQVCSGLVRSSTWLLGLTANARIATNTRSSTESQQRTANKMTHYNNTVQRYCFHTSHRCLWITQTCPGLKSVLSFAIWFTIFTLNKGLSRETYFFKAHDEGNIDDGVLV